MTGWTESNEDRLSCLERGLSVRVERKCECGGQAVRLTPNRRFTPPVDVLQVQCVDCARSADADDLHAALENWERRA